MGNVRLSYFRNGNNSAEVLEENNFYPFGLKHEGYNQTAGNPSYNYQYNGKELQKETGWSDYGARMYMADIGRWGVLDPLAESTTRVSPYNYALNNPVMFVDPDGRKAQSFGSEYEIFGVENSGIIDRFQSQANSFGSLSSFIGDNMPFYYKGAGSEGSGGSSTIIGDIMRSVGITLGSLESFMQMNAVLNLREQLMEAGYEKPEETIAKYSDKDKLLAEVPSLNELLKITKAGFKEDFNIKSPGLTHGQVVLININRIKNILSYAFTLGHEMYGHVFANLFFKNKFSEVTRIPKASPRAFDFFQEIMGLSWEISMGSTRYGDRSGSEAAKTFYGPSGLGYTQPIIDRVNEHLPTLMYEWRIMYNMKKNQLK